LLAQLGTSSASIRWSYALNSQVHGLDGDLSQQKTWAAWKFMDLESKVANQASFRMIKDGYVDHPKNHLIKLVTVRHGLV